MTIIKSWIFAICETFGNNSNVWEFSSTLLDFCLKIPIEAFSDNQNFSQRFSAVFSLRTSDYF